MPIKKGDKVKIDYTGTFEDGTIFDTSKHDEHSHPLEFTVGAGMVIKGFDNAVTGLEKDAEKDFVVQPEEGYGQRNEQMIGKVPRDKIPTPPEGKELAPGMMMVVAQENGQQMPATITEVNDKEVTIDLNHPLAGKVLKFNIKIVDITAAEDLPKEEQAAEEGHSCCSSEDESSCEGCDDCGDSCSVDEKESDKKNEDEKPSEDSKDDTSKTTEEKKED